MKIAYVTCLKTDSDIELGLEAKINHKLMDKKGKLVVLDDCLFHFLYSDGHVRIFYKGQPFEPNTFDILFLGDTLSFDLNREFVRQKISVVNPPDAYFICEDKIKFMALMQEAGIRTPVSVAVKSVEQLRATLESIDPPYVIKHPQREGGVGVFRADSVDSLMSMMSFLWSNWPGQRFLVQEFIETSNSTMVSRDYRCTVIGDRLIPIMRSSREGFRANWSQGSECRLTELTIEEQEIMRRIARLSGLDVMGIDFLKDRDGKMYFTELNQAPGLLWGDEQIDDLHINSLLSFLAGKINR